jgi:hypothetical protein
MAGFSKIQLLPTLHVRLHKLCPMSSGTEISAMVFGQHIHLTLILVIFFFCCSLIDKVYNINHLSEELKKIFVGKLQIFLLNSFKELTRTSSASARNVYVKVDSIFNTSCNL